MNDSLNHLCSTVTWLLHHDADVALVDFEVLRRASSCCAPSTWMEVRPAVGVVLEEARNKRHRPMPTLSTYSQSQATQEIATSFQNHSVVGHKGNIHWT